MGYGSLCLFQAEDVFHQFDHFGAGEIFDLWGNALDGAAQIAQAMGTLGSLTVLIIFLAILQTLDLMTILLDFLFGSFFFAAEFFKLRVRCVC